MRLLAALLALLLSADLEAQTYHLRLTSSGSAIQDAVNAWTELSIVTSIPASSTVLHFRSQAVSQADVSGWSSWITTAYVAAVPPTMKVLDPVTFATIATISSSTPVRINSNQASGTVFRLADGTVIGSAWAGQSTKYGIVYMGGGASTGEYVYKDACGNGTSVYRGRYGDTYWFPRSGGCGYPSQGTVSLSANYLLGY